MRVGAAVDIGSTSVHLLVAGIEGHRLSPVADESDFLGLGSAIADRGFLGRTARRELTDALVRYSDAARALGATSVTCIGTEPLRRAADARTVVQEIGEAARAPLHVVSHEEEAYLTIIGVTAGLPVRHETVVVDVGGGSSEFCVVDSVRRPRAAGLRLGSARLTDRFVTHDPPTPTEVEAMRSSAAGIVRNAPAADPAEIVAAGGTASNLLKLLPATGSDRQLTRDRLRDVLALLRTQPAARTSEQYRINPVRARILPAGAAILEAILERYGLDGLRVSEAGIREGTILAAAHAGPAWRDRLADLAHGWRG